MAGCTGTMKLLAPPCTVYATTPPAVGIRKTFLFHVSHSRNVSFRPTVKRVLQKEVSCRNGESLRCYSSSGDSGSTQHHISQAGSIDSSLMLSMENKIRDALNAEVVTVKDAYGDGRHVSIDVVSSTFEGKSAVNRQRMVYKAIWEELQTTVHAVDQMTTRTPTEAEAFTSD